MRPEEYPPQDPLPAFAASYHEQAIARAAGTPVVEVRYGPDPYQGIGIVVPPRPTGAVMMFLHGGGWTCGYKEWNLFMAPQFAEAGIVFASAGYRLAPGSLFPGQLDDAADAVAWLHRHAAEYGGDPCRLFVGGHSAGGHLAALLATREDWRIARKLPAGVISGCLPVSGVYAFGPGSGLARRPRFLGMEDDLAVDRAASPVHQIRRSTPPFFMAHGEQDFPHLITQAHAMARALHDNGTPVAEMVMPGATHLEAHLATGEAGNAWFDAACRFINDLQPQHSTEAT